MKKNNNNDNEKKNNEKKNGNDVFSIRQPLDGIIIMKKKMM